MKMADPTANALTLTLSRRERGPEFGLSGQPLIPARPRPPRRRKACALGAQVLIASPHRHQTVAVAQTPLAVRVGKDVLPTLAILLKSNDAIPNQLSNRWRLLKKRKFIDPRLGPARKSVAERLELVNIETKMG